MMARTGYVAAHAPEVFVCPAPALGTILGRIRIGGFALGALATLLDIFGDTTGLEANAISTAGSTTAKLMPGASNFGPAMPGKKYTAHNAKKFKEVADLDAHMQMFTGMPVRIGNLKQMQ